MESTKRSDANVAAKNTGGCTLTQFDRWVGENNIPGSFEYGKAWWDYVELVRRFAFKFGIEDVRVVGHHVIHTPPPEELLPMPVAALFTPEATVALKFDFGAGSRWPNEWTVGIQRRSPYLGPTFGLFDPCLDLSKLETPGLAPDFLFPSYRSSPEAFTCELVDEWDVATLLRLVLHEP